MLPYSTEVLFALFAEFNRTAWPVAVTFQVLALAALILVAYRPGQRASARALSALLAAAWAWVGIAFHWWHFAPFNFAAPWYGVAFLGQALLFAWAVLRRELRYRWRSAGVGWIGQALLLYALVGYPLVDWLLGHDWQSLRLFAMAPGPTMLFTMGALLLVQGRTPYHLLVIPVLWGVVGGVLAWRSGLPQDAILPVASLLGLGLVVARNRRT
ncbi:hypothetical protein SAMN02745148_01915 [Modicisalibacter ilicicola DSM 19980]|uniref:Uncharacterized protein n=1 Tax=Modicisalibacter ilicicola DSM 19980 TaxID=1121942 RepID=A0A1M4Z974_9GAMM|nr:DUF6064 family protein [Halomonas ilicicola]SHF14571.1 hypothetical protein SAMN02745148_01915 [Halomonas ilicicola DSM 19980]